MHISRSNAVSSQHVPADETNFLAGAVVYKQQCAACHGLPEQPPPDYAATNVSEATAVQINKDDSTSGY